MSTPTQHPPVTRKDISGMLGYKLTAKQIGRREKDLGLHVARVKLPTRMALYHHAKVVLILKNSGAID